MGSGMGHSLFRLPLPVYPALTIHGQTMDIFVDLLRLLALLFILAMAVSYAVLEDGPATLSRRALRAFGVAVVLLMILAGDACLLSVAYMVIWQTALGLPLPAVMPLSLQSIIAVTFLAQCAYVSHGYLTEGMVEEPSATEYLSEGYVRKGGRNPPPDMNTSRPAPPRLNTRIHDWDQ